MKKLLIGILSVLAIASLAACGNQDDIKSSSNNSTNSAVQNNVEQDVKPNDVQNTQTVSDAEKYKEVIDEYKNAMGEVNLENIGDEEILNKYPLISETLVTHVARYKDEGVKLTYSFYDIDKNGVNELLVGASGSVGAIYTYDGANNTPAKIYFQDTMERGNLEIYDNGVILSSGSGGAALHYYEFGKIATNGTSYELLEDIEEEFMSENEAPVYRDTNTREILEYTSIDEAMTKYVANAKALENIEYSEM